MSMINQMMLAVNRYQSNIGYVKLGLVSSTDPATSQMKVVLQPEGTETGWIPYPSPWAGNGFGWYAPVESGTHVIVLFQEGSKDVPIGAMSLYWVAAQPPQNVALGEAIMMHATGSYIKFGNDGSITVNVVGDLNASVSGDINATVTGNANLTIDGELTANVTGNSTLTTPLLTINGDLAVTGTIAAGGNITDLNGANGSMQDIRTVYNEHVHPVPGIGDTGLPDPLIP